MLEIKSFKKYTRIIYYRLSPKMRFMVRRLFYFPQELFRKKNSILPPNSLIYTGAGDFEKQGVEWRKYFIENGLKPDHSFLDIGSGIGRIAIGLKDFLKGEYRGFEAMELGVNWCQNNITTKYPNFQFKWVQLYNNLYNSKGIDAAKYKFDYPKNNFDFMASISVFTHMTDKEVENYLFESQLVLKDKGILVATFFIMENDLKMENKYMSETFTFPYEYENYYLMDNKVTAANVCFKEDYLMSLIEKSGFEIVNRVKGYWSGSPKTHYLGFQDILVLQKRE